MNDEIKIPDELVITFAVPIEFGGQRFDHVRLREPLASEVARWDKLEGTDADITGISIVAGVPKPVVEKMTIRDLNKGSRYLALFFA